MDAGSGLGDGWLAVGSDLGHRRRPAAGLGGLECARCVLVCGWVSGGRSPLPALGCPGPARLGTAGGVWVGASRVKGSAFGTIERGHGRDGLVAGCQSRRIHRVWQCRGCRLGRGGVWVVSTAGRKPRPAPSSFATRGMAWLPGARRVEYAAFGSVEGAGQAGAGCGWCQPRDESRVRHHRARPHAGRPASLVSDAWNTPPLAVPRGPIRPGQGLGGASRVEYAAFGTVEGADQAGAGCGWCQPRDESRVRHHRARPHAGRPASRVPAAWNMPRSAGRKRPTRQRRTLLVPTASRCTAVGTTQRPCRRGGSLGIDHLANVARP